MFDTLIQMASFDFAKRALIAMICVTLICGLLSPLVVLKQRAYLSDTVAHFVFPGVVVGMLCSQYAVQYPLLSPWVCILCGAILSSLVGAALSEWILRKGRMPPDAAAVVCLSGFMALGVLLLSWQKGLRLASENLFFGNILTLQYSDVVILLCCLVLVVGCVVPLAKHWDAWLVDAEFAEIAGFRVRLLNRLFPVLLTLSVLSGIFAVGSLMISALLTIPSLLIAPRSVFSVRVILLSLCLGLLGLFFSFLGNWPVGPTTVLVGLVALCVKTAFFQRGS